MGVWGSGLYAGDFALDLRSVVKVVARLPFDGEKLVDLLCETEPMASSNPDDEDHTTFWLVVADQLAKIGIVSARARDMVLQIIDGGRDTAMLARLGAGSLDLTKRQKMLDNLPRSQTATPKSVKTRSVLQKPQPLVMDVGDLFVYPTSLGRCRQYCLPRVRVVPPGNKTGGAPPSS